MWSFVITHNCTGGLYVLVANSFIHSLMYTYYTFAALGYSLPFKQYLTQAQIIQFILGVIVTVPCYYYINEAQKISLFFIHLYTNILIYLFYQFYIDNYSKNIKQK